MHGLFEGKQRIFVFSILEDHLMPNYVRFFLGLLAPIAIFIGFIVVGSMLILTTPDRVPAPAVSNSLSFNEKARWMRTKAALDRCKILVLGSSVALNNIDHEVLANRFGTVDTINAASWALSFAQSEQMLEALASRCHPGLIIWVIYHDELSGTSEFNVQWNDFGSYIGGRNLLLSYFASADIPYYVRTWWKGDESLRYGRSKYSSVDFDAYGGVNLDCDHFQYNPSRWTDFLDDNGRVKGLSVDFDSLKRILIRASGIAAFQQAKVVFVTSPLRGIAEQEFHFDELNRIWESFSQLAASFSTHYVRVRNLGRYPDSLFVDTDHLNACGAKIFTEELASQISTILGLQIDIDEQHPKPWMIDGVH